MKQEKSTIWDRNALKNPHAVTDKQQRIQWMFSDIAATYDRLNHLLSLHLDHHWRKKAVESAMIEPEQTLLDLCCGTGDLAYAFARKQPNLSQIIGLDFSEPMLAIAKNKYSRLISARKICKSINFKWLCANAQDLPFPDLTFDRVSCAFGIRNLQNLPQGLQEMYRVLKPNGKAVVLEFSLPKNPALAWIYNLHFRLVIPFLGSIISGNRSAYHYLPQSVIRFFTKEQLETLLIQAGFADVKIETLTGGTVLLIVANKNG
jgi:demethylmenaquinone methyltransferase/2-methoxy-6-polyprenyl-1,4-benzoquinol methylase